MRDSSSRVFESSDAAFLVMVGVVIERAGLTGTPVSVWGDGQVRWSFGDEFEKRSAGTSQEKATGGEAGLVAGGEFVRFLSVMHGVHDLQQLQSCRASGSQASLIG